MPAARQGNWLLFRALRGVAGSWRGDLLAGLTVAAIAAPEQMATARLGGFAPSVGFYAFVAGSLGFAMFGANRFLSAGADSTITPIFAASLALLATSGDPHYATLAALLAVLVGLFMLGAGFFRAGWVANLLSIPVLTGFLAGIAVHIVLSQMPALLGLPGGSGSSLRRVGQIAGQIGDVKLLALAVGLACLAVIVAMEKWVPRAPGALLAVAGATLGALAFGVDPRDLPRIGAFAASWPHLAWPEVAVEDYLKTIGLAAIISLVVMVQTAATSRAYPGLPGEFPDIDRDFLGLGAGGVLAGLLGAFPVNASPPRTAMVVESGGKTQAVGIFAAVAVALVAGFGEVFLRHAPEASLAAILFFVAGRIFRLGDMREILRRSRPEFLLAVITAAAVVLLPVQTGVALAIMLSLIHGAWSTTQTDLQVFERLPGETIWWPRHPSLAGESLAGVAVVGFQAPLSFLNAERFRRQLETMAAQANLRLLILEASSINSIDYTAAKALAAAIEACHARDVDFAIARLESVRTQEAMAAYGLIDALAHDGVRGEARLFHSVDGATRLLAPDAATIDKAQAKQAAI